MRFATITLFLTCISVMVGGPAWAQPRTWRFDVLLDGRRIGEHDFTLAQAGDHAEVRSQARFSVSALFVPLYRYQHESRESWRSGCLQRIDARTVDNGAETSVRGERTMDGFELHAPRREVELPECVKTFAYWDAGFLNEANLLNPQTGEYQPVETQALGRETLSVRGREVQAQRHALRTDDFRIDVWYAPDGDWLALESRTPEGRRLRYERR